MNYLDLFHGIGGFALGAYWAGMKFENHYCSDIEPYCQKLYAQRFSESIQLGDIIKIRTEDLPNGEWIITGGFPCQDISIAGGGQGITGSRSGLWFEYWRLIRDLRPRFAIMENVGALSFRGLDRVLGSLAEIGYDAEWTNISAREVGAWHERSRIWIIAYPNTHKIRRERATSKKFYPTCSSQQFWRKDAFDQLLFSEKLFSQSDTQNTRMANGIPFFMERFAGLGNAIVPQIAELLFNQIKPYIPESVK